MQRIDNPNKAKNRSPAVEERNTLREMIKLEEKRVSEPNAEIPMLRSRLENYQSEIEDLEAKLLVPEVKEQYARVVTKLLDILSFVLPGPERKIDLDIELPDMFVFPEGSRDRLALDMDDLRAKHDEYYRAAQEVARKSSTEVKGIKLELDARKSLYHFSKMSLNSVNNMKRRVLEQLKFMKEVTAAHRQMPHELWAQIFTLRVLEDEKEYSEKKREGNPPFTTLKLTWVCQSWRAIIHDLPALWRYIAIPRNLRVTAPQKERIEYYMKCMKSSLPIVYSVPDSSGNEDNLVALLQPIPSFERLEIHISSSSDVAEDLIESISPTVHDLVLIGEPDTDLPVTYCALKYGSIRSVKSISCFDIRLDIKEQDGQDGETGIEAISFEQAHIDKGDLFGFLMQVPSINSVGLLMKWPYNIENDVPLAAVLLDNITNITAHLTVLGRVFDDEVVLPNLKSLMVKLEYFADAQTIKEDWESFLATHHRAGSIVKLGLSGIPLIEVPDGVPEVCRHFVGQVPNVEHLILEGDIVQYALEGLSGEDKVPLKLNELTIQTNTDVTEEEIGNFLKMAHKVHKRPLILHLANCSSLSEEVKQRLGHIHTTVQSK